MKTIIWETKHLYKPSGSVTSSLERYLKENFAA